MKTKTFFCPAFNVGGRRATEPVCRVVQEREEHGDEEIEIVLIPAPGEEERRQDQRYLVAGGEVGEVGGHGQVEAGHDQEDPQVGGQELRQQDQAMAGVAQTSLQSDGRDGDPGVAGHPQQGVGHQGVAVLKVELIMSDLNLDLCLRPIIAL